MFKNLLRFGRSSRTAFFALLIFSAIVGISAGANPQVTLQISGDVSGTIVLELYAEEAPITTANFLRYVKSGFYNDLIFHRVANGVAEDPLFVIQGGGLDMSHNPKIPGPAIINESSNGLSNLRGTIAMARENHSDSATSQFFINHQDNTGLDYRLYPPNPNYISVGYCVFGKIIDGLDVMDEISGVATTSSVPDIDIIIDSAIITLDEPVCMEKLDGDIDGDCDVDLGDYAFFADTWLMENSTPHEANFNFDDIVNMVDFVIFAAAWGTVYGETRYNGACDLHSDGVIDEQDLVVFTEHWLDGGQ